jgi:hypothetical protein
MFGRLFGGKKKAAKEAEKAKLAEEAEKVRPTGARLARNQLSVRWTARNWHATGMHLALWHAAGTQLTPT